MMTTSLHDLKHDLLSAVEGATDLDQLEDVRVKALGKKGVITLRLQELGKLQPDERKARGAELNDIKTALALKMDERKAALAHVSLNARLRSEAVDVTLPAAPAAMGRVHPISQTIEEIITLFSRMGFTLADGPNVEDDWHNFTALNMPETHPARQMQDTFYLPPAADGKKMLLRTHTSNMQIRHMTQNKPPIRIISLGRTYRSDSDQTHTPMFHQVEAVMIDKSTHFGHLKGCLMDFCRQFFGIADLPFRFRPSFFPFTEPSAEVDIGCTRSKNGLTIGAGSDWLEIGGCGMAHPNVLKNCGIDPTVYQGFTFGMGVERMAMLKYGIPDLRTFFDSDSRWLKHYGFLPFDVPGSVVS